MKVEEMKRKHTNRVIYTREFENISDFLKYMNEGNINTTAFPDKPSSQTKSYSFTQTKSFEEANELLSNGWAEGATNLTKSLKVANAQMKDKEVTRAIYDIVGFQASVPRYLQGIPTSMVNKRTVKQKQKVVTLVKSINYNSAVSSEAIVRDSVKFLQIVQDVEKKGIRANVYVFFHAVKGNEELHYRIKIKSSSERINISKMSYPLIHPSFLRRHIFRAMEVEPRIKNNWNYGYGMPASDTDVKSVLKDNEYYIPVLIDESQALEILFNVDTDTSKQPKKKKQSI